MMLSVHIRIPDGRGCRRVPLDEGGGQEDERARTGWGTRHGRPARSGKERSGSEGKTASRRGREDTSDVKQKESIKKAAEKQRVRGRERGQAREKAKGQKTWG